MNFDAEESKPNLYVYKARISTHTRRHPWYDADSPRGSSTSRYASMASTARSFTKEGGEKTRDYVRSLLSEGDEIVARTYKDRTGKYRCYLADVYLSDGTHLNEHLIEKGHATQYLAA